MDRANPSPSSFRGGGTPPDRIAMTERPTTRRPLDPNFATFVTLHSRDPDRKLARLSPVIIKKVIDYNVQGEVKNVKRLASGDLRIETFNCVQVKQLLKLRTFHDIPTEASIPVSENSCRGVLYHPSFVFDSDEEMLDGLARHHVVEISHFTKLVNGVRNKTGACVATFGVPTLPEEVKYGYESVSVRPYIPNPLRCFRCQLFGHHGNACRSSTQHCGKCAAEGHDTDSCASLTLKCRNCGDAHSSSSRDCPVWKQEKEVCTVKVTQGLTYFEARKLVKEQQAALAPPSPDASYAEKASPKPVMVTIAVQTDPLPDAPVADAEPASSASQTSASASTSTASTSTASTSTDTCPTPKTSFSKAVANTPRQEKTDKNDKKNKVNLTPLPKRSRTRASPASPRERGRARAPSASSRESIPDESMDISSGRHRERSPGSSSADDSSTKKKKKTKNNGNPRNS